MFRKLTGTLGIGQWKGAGVIESLDSVVCGSGTFYTDFFLCAHQVALEHTQPLVFNVVSNGWFTRFDCDALLNSESDTIGGEEQTLACVDHCFSDNLLL